MISLNYIVTALIVALIPGTGVMYTVNTGLVKKTAYSFAAAVGCTLGIVPHIIACILGLSALMNMGARFFTIIKYCGSAYLLYLAWKTWKESGKTEYGTNPEEDKRGLWSTAAKGILLNLLNPKLTLFFFSFLPQFIPENAANRTQFMIVLSAVFMLITLLVFALYGFLASKASSLLLRRTSIRTYIERGFALIFASLAIKVAVSDR